MKLAVNILKKQAKQLIFNICKLDCDSSGREFESRQSPHKIKHLHNYPVFLFAPFKIPFTISFSLIRLSISPK
jgi:hypothetical protein